jgi:hypothetical protein
MKRNSLSKLTFLLATLLSHALMTTQVASAVPLKDDTWKIVNSPNGSLHNSILFGVVTISTQNAWAVGNTYNRDNVDNTPLIEHWNGSRWNVVPSPNPGTNNQLNEVMAVSANDIWAMGIYFTGSGTRGKTLIEHWNGGRWSVIPSPNVGTQSNILTGGTAIS